MKTCLNMYLIDYRCLLYFNKIHPTYIKYFRKTNIIASTLVREKIHIANKCDNIKQKINPNYSLHCSIDAQY